MSNVVDFNNEKVSDKTKSPCCVDKSMVGLADEGEPAKDEQVQDTGNMFGNLSARQIENMIKYSRDMVRTMEQSWTITSKEFNLTEQNMKDIYDYNQHNMNAMPENITEEERESWDFLNGLDNITDDAIEKIFGKEHKIYGVNNDITRSRIKTSMQDFMNYLCAMREFKQINDAYMKLLDERNETNMKQLQIIADNETDPVKKAEMQRLISEYNSTKNLDFLANPLTEDEINRIVNAFYDSNKLNYYIQRTQDKLKQINISTGIILEISQFEKRFLGDEKYNKLNNILLLYFMIKVIFSNIKSDVPSNDKSEIVAFVMAMDGIIRNVMPKDERDHILENIRIFENQFLDKIADKEESN